MTPRQFPSHPTARAAGAVAILCLFVHASEIPFPVASAAGPESISWRSDYNSAYFEAKSEKRLLWIQFTGPWCPNCRRMERDSFPQTRIVEQARESFVSVKLRSDENEDLAMHFNLTGLPATVLIDPASQKILSLHQGYLGPDELGAVFGEAVALRENRRESNDTQLTATKKRDGLNPALLMTFSRIHEQGIRTDFGVSNLPVAWLCSIMKVGIPPQYAESAATRSNAHLALSGYCPVSLVTTHKLVRGKPNCAVNHDGKLYRFANSTMTRLFLENPDRYIPINDGHCPVTGVDHEKALPGDARYGVLYRERLYLCATSEHRGRFLHDPERYALAHVEEKGNCPHCSKQDGLLVQGDPRFGLIRSGREYWFPDAEHRSAFLSSLSGDSQSTRK